MEQLLINLLGRRNAWRLGRRLYMAARGETRNAMEENGEAAVLTDLLRIAPADRPFVIWDVGANRGDWTDMALQRARSAGRDVSIEAFEPAPATFHHLAERYAGCSNVRTHKLALSDRNGTASFEIVGHLAGTNSLSLSRSSGAQVVEVETITGGDMWHRLGGEPVDFVKVDAEGHDLAVLRGLMPLIADGKVSVLQFEYNWRWLIDGGSLRQVFDFMARYDYRVAVVRPDRLEVYENWNIELDRFFEANFALVRREVLPKMKHTVTKWDVEANLPVA